MLAIDAPPKTKQKPNKVKIDENHPLMDLDKRLRHELDAFQEKIHAEIWGDVMDFLFSSHVFLTTPQILHLCHLAHANALHTLEDLENNFQWNWMPDYGHTLLKLIHHIYDFKPSTTISPNDEIGTSNSPLNSSQPSAIKLNNRSDQSSSESTRTGEPRVKKGLGSQCCSACSLLGHNSKSCNHGSIATSLTDPTLQELNPHCPKKTSSSPTGITNTPILP